MCYRLTVPYKSHLEKTSSFLECRTIIVKDSSNLYLYILNIKTLLKGNQVLHRIPPMFTINTSIT